MAAIDQINVNIGTEQSPNYVLHDVNDKRISSTAVTTATHLLATDASLSAINPITAANLASVLGVNATLWEENFGTSSSSAVLTKRGLRQAILIVTQNGPTRAPSIYVLKRDSIYHTICEGETKAADISIDSTTGAITITKNEGLSMYTRTILLEA